MFLGLYVGCLLGLSLCFWGYMFDIIQAFHHVSGVI